MITVRDLDFVPEPDSAIYPSVLIDGLTCTPPGWMWLLVFALRGHPWAIKQLEECDPVTLRPIDIYSLALGAARIQNQS